MARDIFLSEEQEQQVIDAIARAENKTSGEIRIHIEPHCKKEPLARAKKIFHALGMDQTELQNGVLIYIANEDKKAAVYAGAGIHTQVEEHFWQDVLDIILTHFKKQDYGAGIAKSVTQVGEKLKELFPYQAGDTNELTDEISYEHNEK